MDGFYICYILLPSPDIDTFLASAATSHPSQLTHSSRSSQLSYSSRSSKLIQPSHSSQLTHSSHASQLTHSSPSSPSSPSGAGNVVRRVTVLNGGAESYELTGLRAGAAYQLFLVPFRGGREGRLSRLREVRLPEAGQWTERIWCVCVWGGGERKRRINAVWDRNTARSEDAMEKMTCLG